MRAACAAAAVGAVMLAVITSASGSASTRAAATRTPAATRSPALTRYALAHGCYRVSFAAADGPFRMQPAALGVYLLYTPHATYLADHGGITVDSEPGPAAQWRVDRDAAHGFTLTDLATGTRRPATLVPAAGCATYPEAQVDATGTPFRGASPEASVLGTMEGHAHVTAFEFFGGDWHCGRPWSPYGAPFALPASCAPEQQGTNGLAESFLDYGGATRPSGMHGWPTFVDWPSPTSLAEEGDYYTAIERAWKAGLRLMVTNLVDNQALCSIMTTRHNPCDDMADVRIQSRDLYALQDYIDAQSGGPGKGWFRIVTDPFQARRVINAGRLAVVEGVEMSEIFGCGEQDGQPLCDRAQIDSGLNEFRKLGVRTFFPIHEFNNAFGGSKMIAGDTGVLINAGNRYETGSFFTLQPCPARDQDAEQVTTAPAGPLTQLLNGPVSSLLHGDPLPVYGTGPQCNAQGITDLGTYVIEQMIRRHMIIQLDHMDSKTAAAALAIAAAHHYSGVVSAHCCNSPQLFHGVYATGGFVDPPVEPANAFLSTWRSDKAQDGSRYHFGFGYGSDMNGLASQPGPNPAYAITYPFHSYLGHVTFGREVWGRRSFDLNRDGLANYGLYADWLRELQVVGGAPIMHDMFQGAEAYLEMWERAFGVPATRCLATVRLGTGHGFPRLGQTATQALYAGGQPLARVGRAFRYCDGRRIVFDRRGRVALIASSGRRDSAGGVHPGQHFLALSGSRRFVHGTRHGQISWVGFTTARGAALRADLRQAGL
jgi:hypothetical protein